MIRNDLLTSPTPNPRRTRVPATTSQQRAKSAELFDGQNVGLRRRRRSISQDLTTSRDDQASASATNIEINAHSHDEGTLFHMLQMQGLSKAVSAPVLDSNYQVSEIL